MPPSAASRTIRGIAHQTRTFYTNKLPEVCCIGCVLVYPVGSISFTDSHNRKQGSGMVVVLDWDVNLFLSF